MPYTWVTWLYMYSRDFLRKVWIQSYSYPTPKMYTFCSDMCVYIYIYLCKLYCACVVRTFQFVFLSYVTFWSRLKTERILVYIILALLLFLIVISLLRVYFFLYWTIIINDYYWNTGNSYIDIYILFEKHIPIYSK